MDVILEQGNRREVIISLVDDRFDFDRIKAEIHNMISAHVMAPIFAK